MTPYSVTCGGGVGGGGAGLVLPALWPAKPSASDSAWMRISDDHARYGCVESRLRVAAPGIRQATHSVVGWRGRSAFDGTTGSDVAVGSDQRMHDR